MTMTLAPSWQAVGAGTSGGGSAELDEDAGSEVAWAWLHLLETDLRIHDLEVLELKVDEYPYGLALESHGGSGEVRVPPGWGGREISFGARVKWGEVKIP